VRLEGLYNKTSKQEVQLGLAAPFKCIKETSSDMAQRGAVTFVSHLHTLHSIPRIKHLQSFYAFISAFNKSTPAHRFNLQTPSAQLNSR
jgi:hypothetical protein